MSQIEIFFSYSHKDEVFKDELEKQLSPLKWRGIITNWTDRAIMAGQEWAEEISTHLDTAQIILLLVSPDFMASRYCYSIEMKRAVERHERGEACVIPVILRSVYWQDAPFGKLQALPRDGRPVKNWSDQDEALYNVAEGIRKVVNELQAKLSSESAKATEQLTVTTATSQTETVPQSNQQVNIPIPTTNKAASPDDASLKVERQEAPVQKPRELPSVQVFEPFQLKYVLTEHTESVRSVTINPDGQTFVSGSDDKTMKVWNLHTGKIEGHLGMMISTDGVKAVAISPDGHTLISGSGDKTVEIWNLHTGGLLRVLKEHKGWVTSLAVTPNGQVLVSGSYDKTAKVWNLHTGELLRTFTEHAGWVTGVAISPDGQTLVTGSSDTVKVWNLYTGELLHTLTEHGNWVYSVTISPDGYTLISGGNDNTVRAWNLHTGKLLHTFVGHTGWVTSVAISPDGHSIVSGSNDKTVRIWSL